MPNEVPYLVVWSRKAQDVLKALSLMIASSKGRKRLAELITAINDRLRREPTAVGEIYRSKGNVEEYLAVCEFLSIDFAVDEQRKVVQVRVCRVLSGHGGDPTANGEA
jgi:hypothetical protein